MPGPVLSTTQTHNRVGCGPCSQVLMRVTSRERQRRHYTAGTSGMWLAYCFPAFLFFESWGCWWWINCAGGELVWGQKKKKKEISALHVMSGWSQHYISQSSHSSKKNVASWALCIITYFIREFQGCRGQSVMFMVTQNDNFFSLPISISLCWKHPSVYVLWASWNLRQEERDKIITSLFNWKEEEGNWLGSGDVSSLDFLYEYLMYETMEQTLDNLNWQLWK